MTLRDLQSEHARWMDREFPNREIWMHIAKLGEEAGELAAWYLRRIHRMGRSTEPSERLGRAEVGDCAAVLMAICSDMGWDFEKIIEQRLSEVLQRTEARLR